WGVTGGRGGWARPATPPQAELAWTTPPNHDRRRRAWTGARPRSANVGRLTSSPFSPSPRGRSFEAATGPTTKRGLNVLAATAVHFDQRLGVPSRRTSPR